MQPTLVSGGIGFYEAGNDGKNSQYQAKATTVLGAHQLRYGVLFEDINYDNINQRTGPTFTAPNGEVTATGAQISILPEITGLGQIYRVTRANFVSARQTRQQYTSFFVQDTFTLGNRLTIKPGIRYEQQKLIGQLVSATGTTDNDFTLDGNWAPRIGATYDITGNGRSKIFANWGRFYAKIPNDLAARALSADAGISLADYFDPNLTQPIPDGQTTVTQTTGRRSPDDDQSLPAAGIESGHHRSRTRSRPMSTSSSAGSSTKRSGTSTSACDTSIDRFRVCWKTWGVSRWARATSRASAAVSTTP